MCIYKYGSSTRVSLLPNNNNNNNNNKQFLQNDVILWIIKIGEK